MATGKGCKINQKRARHPVLIKEVTDKPKEWRLCGRCPQIESNGYFAVERGNHLFNSLMSVIVQLHDASLHSSATAELRSGLERANHDAKPYTRLLCKSRLEIQSFSTVTKGTSALMKNWSIASSKVFCEKPRSIADSIVTCFMLVSTTACWLLVTVNESLSRVMLNADLTFQ